MSVLTAPTRQSAPARGADPGCRALMDDYAARFEQVYRDAGADHARIPWAHAHPNDALIPWLNVEAPSLVRPGGRVVVIGCGLGHDVIELLHRGYDATGFDICQSAIDGAMKLHPRYAERFQQADLLDPPPRFRHRFDLAVDVHTLQSVPPGLWAPMAGAMAELLGPHGVMVSICRGRPDDVPLEQVEGPPFSLTPADLIETFAAAGLAPTRAADDFEDDNSPPVRRLRCAFRRASAAASNG